MLDQCFLFYMVYPVRCFSVYGLGLCMYQWIMVQRASHPIPPSIWEGSGSVHITIIQQLV